MNTRIKLFPPLALLAPAANSNLCAVRPIEPSRLSPSELRRIIADLIG